VTGVYVFELAGEDDAFAACEARAAVPEGDVSVVAPGLATAPSVAADRARGLAYTRHVGERVATTAADVSAARDALAAASIDRSGAVAVRARDVRSTADIDTQHAERALGDALAARGFAIDLDTPDHELRALFADDTCLLAWGVAASDRDFGARAPTDRPFFQPGSMDPLLARAIVNIAGARPGHTLLDPLCGTGGLLVEASLVGSDVIGCDAQERMVRGTRENLSAYVLAERVRGLAIADAARLPIADDAVDAVAFDAPYGRQSKIAGRSLDDLVAATLAESARVADRAVVTADQQWRTAAERAGFAVERVFERRVHRSLVRYIHVLERA
jgi:tRNA (guanine10-N2)-dimethyltransferase